MDKTLFTIPGVMSPPECRAMIATMEQRGFEAAPVTTARGFVMMPDLRNNTRVILDDAALAASLWDRVKGHVADGVAEGCVAVGLNERFRIYRYDHGQAFRWHRDGAYVRDERERSRLTFMIYLNEGFVGGATEFEYEHVIPAEGLAIVFAHGLRHQGAEILDVRKYVLRSDVMFRKA